MKCPRMEKLQKHTVRNDDHRRWLVERVGWSGQNGLDLFQRLVLVLSNYAVADFAVLGRLLGAQLLELDRFGALHIDKAKKYQRCLIG